MSSSEVLTALKDMGEFVKSASSPVDGQVASELLRRFGDFSDQLNRGQQKGSRVSGWQAGAVQRPSTPEIEASIRAFLIAFPQAIAHREALAALGSQFVYARPVRSGAGPAECYVVLIRFSAAIEAAFGVTREVMAFYSPYSDLQIRTFKFARQKLSELPREVTPDLFFFFAPDIRIREKLDDWSRGTLLAIPLSDVDADDPVSFIKVLRDFVFTRDLFYETTPVKGEKFFGRRHLLQSLRDDVRNQRVTGLYGLRKAGKTSVLTELRDSLDGDHTVVLLQDLESLPSPPTDPIPELVRDIVDNLRTTLKDRGLPTRDLAEMPKPAAVSDFKAALRGTLRQLLKKDTSVVLLLDEIEYLIPSAQAAASESELTSISQFLAVLRSTVQENENFTFILSGLTSAITESGRLYGRPNPLFSWAKSSYVSPFDASEAAELARSIGQRMGIEIEQNALDALYEATGGHAYLYRHLASTVVQTLPVDVFQRKMSRASVLGVQMDWRRNISGNIAEMLDHVKRYYAEESFLLEVLMDEPEEFEELADSEPSAVGHLLSLGLIESKDNSFELSPVLHLL